jgi:hypothetical protein
VLATAVSWTSVPGTHLSYSDLMRENVLPGGGLENRCKCFSERYLAAAALYGAEPQSGDSLARASGAD